jgi:hypothetical protein
MCEDFAPSDMGDKKKWLLHDNTPSLAFFCHQDIVDKKQHDCHPPPTLLFSVSQLKTKLKDCH